MSLKKYKNWDQKWVYLKIIFIYGVIKSDKKKLTNIWYNKNEFNNHKLYVKLMQLIKKINHSSYLSIKELNYKEIAL